MWPPPASPADDSSFTCSVKLINRNTKDGFIVESMVGLTGARGNAHREEEIGLANKLRAASSYVSIMYISNYNVLGLLHATMIQPNPMLYSVISPFQVAGLSPRVSIICVHLPLPLSFLSMYFRSFCLLCTIKRRLLLLCLSLCP